MRAAPQAQSGVGDVRGISHVCVRWRSIINTTPHFWTNINASDGPLVKHNLERSGSLPLSIKLRSSASKPLPLPVLSNFLTLIEKDAHRFRVLDVDATYDDWRIIAPCVAQQMPLLETAELAVEGMEEHDLPALVFGETSKLSYLRLDNVMLWIPRTDDMYWPLTRLQIDGIWPESATPLLRLLRRCPSLTELVIQYAWVEGEPDDDPTFPISLPSLRVLEISESFGPISGPLLRCIHAPNIKRFKISEDYSYGDSTFSFLVRPPLSPDRPTLLQSALLNVAFRSLDISLEEDFVTLIGVAAADQATTAPPGEKWGFELKVNDSEPSSVVDMVRHIHFPDVPTHLQILGSHHDPSILGSFPFATSVTLHGYMDFIEHCVVLLCEPDEDTGRMDCPVLSELHLDLDEQTPRDALEANDSLMKDLNQLIRVRRADVEGDLRVTCGLKRWGKERCRFIDSEATGRFADEESA